MDVFKKIFTTIAFLGPPIFGYFLGGIEAIFPMWFIFFIVYFIAFVVYYIWTELF